MNSTTAQLTKGITSLALDKFLAQGGEVLRCETLQLKPGPDGQVHVLDLEGRHGTVVIANADPVWYDAGFDAVVGALEEGDTSIEAESITDL